MVFSATQKEVLDQLSTEEFKSAVDIKRRIAPLFALYESGYLIVRPVTDAALKTNETDRRGVKAYKNPRTDLLWKLRRPVGENPV